MGQYFHARSKAKEELSERAVTGWQLFIGFRGAYSAPYGTQNLVECNKWSGTWQ
jgi:hypothetical protein